jgi:hypothetical protein
LPAEHGFPYIRQIAGRRGVHEAGHRVGTVSFGVEQFVKCDRFRDPLLADGEWGRRFAGSRGRSCGCARDVAGRCGRAGVIGRRTAGGGSAASPAELPTMVIASAAEMIVAAVSVPAMIGERAAGGDTRSLRVRNIPGSLVRMGPWCARSLGASSANGPVVTRSAYAARSLGRPISVSWCGSWTQLVLVKWRA